MKRIQGLAAVLAVAALAGGGAVAAASSSGSGTGTTTTGTTATAPTTTGTATSPTLPQRPHPGWRGPGFGGRFGPGGFDFFDTATKTALTETFAAVETARTTASDAGKSPDEIRDAAIAAAKARLDQAVTDGALTKAQGAAVLAALTKQAGARAAVIDAAAAVLKLTPTELAKRLASGDRLDEIATAQGVDIEDVFSAIMKLDQGPGGASGILGPMGGFRGRGGFGFGRGMGHGGFCHHGFDGMGPGHRKGQAPAPPTQTQPSTQSGSFAPPAATSHI
jgi:hypothetical protein